MKILGWIVASVLGVFLIAMGVMKFTGAHVFAYIEARALAENLPLAGYFDPYVNDIVGAAEILAGALIILPTTRFWGGLLGLGVIAGAIAFHLSPYLGVATPTGFADGAAAPWELSDFTPADPDQYSPILFYVALVMAALALINLTFSRAR